MNSKALSGFLIAAALFMGGNHTALAAGLGNPEPHLYLVYSGTGTSNDFTAGSTGTATTTESGTVYVLADLANPSSFSVLTVNPDGTYHISTRVLSSNGTCVAATNDGHADYTATNPTQNFIWGVSNDAKSPSLSPTKGFALFQFSGTEGTDTVTVNSIQHTYPKVHNVHATGSLTGLSTTDASTIIPADLKSKISGIYVINAIPTALTNYIGVTNDATTLSYPVMLSGTNSKYEYDSTLITTPVAGVPALYTTSVSGTVTLKLDNVLTSLANVGGAYKKTVFTPMNGVAGQLNSGSSPTVYEDFLYEIVLSLGLTPVYVPSP